MLDNGHGCAIIPYMKVKKKQILVRVHEWMYNELRKEARAQMIPTSVNRLVVEALLAKYRRLENAGNIRELVPPIQSAKPGRPAKEKT